MPVFVFSDHDQYLAFCNDRHAGACPSPFGEYSRSRRQIVMHATAGAETVLHEMVHAVAVQEWVRMPRGFDEVVARDGD